MQYLNQIVRLFQLAHKSYYRLSSLKYLQFFKIGDSLKTPEIYTRITGKKYIRVSRVRNVVFRKLWRALFSWKTRFEIRPFALLPTT